MLMGMPHVEDWTTVISIDPETLGLVSGAVALMVTFPSRPEVSSDTLDPSCLSSPADDVHTRLLS